MIYQSTTRVPNSYYHCDKLLNLWIGLINHKLCGIESDHDVCSISQHCKGKSNENSFLLHCYLIESETGS